MVPDRGDLAEVCLCGVADGEGAAVEPVARRRVPRDARVEGGLRPGPRELVPRQELQRVQVQVHDPWSPEAIYQGNQLSL